MYKITGGAGDLTVLPMGGEGDVPGSTFTTLKGRKTGRVESVNYGGVNITMNFPQGDYSPQKIKEAVREVLVDDNIRKHAVSK